MPVVKERAIVEHSRLNVRLSPDVKDRIAKAATILGQDLTEFAVATLNERAVEVIEKNEQVVLSREQYQFFLDALDEPAQESSEYSLKALEKYRRGERKGVRYKFAD